MTTGWKLMLSAVMVMVIGCGVSAPRRFADPRFAQQGRVVAGDPGCEQAKLVSTGGAFPENPRTLAIRWTGYTNFELVYNGQIILLDAHFDRGSMFPSLGFSAADVKRANVLLLGTRASRSHVRCRIGGRQDRRDCRRRAGDDG